MKELLMGNEAIAVGALAAGVQVVAGYPGTPSSEVLETIARRNPGGVYVEWSVNEKAGAEVAAGAAYSGARSMVTMKQMGLNVASDPIMCVNYIGVKGGMVIYVADDPGPISSQTEQDTRHFGKYARIPVFDCDSPEQAFRAVQDAFDFSEREGTPVILRSTTRVCHACADIDVPELTSPAPAEGFSKDPRWVIFPALSYRNKQKLVSREPEFASLFSAYEGNRLEAGGRIGIACGGISYAYVKEAIAGCEDRFTVFKVATPYPFPTGLAARFLSQVDRILCFEELDPVIEDALIYQLGCQLGCRSELGAWSGIEAQDPCFGEDDHGPCSLQDPAGTASDPCSHLRILGKRDGTVPAAGELSAVAVAEILARETGISTALAPPSRNGVAVDAPASGIQGSKASSQSALDPDAPAEKISDPDPAGAPDPDLPVRPPVLCAGCPHRGAFYAVKRAVAKAQKNRPPETAAPDEAGRKNAGPSFTQAVYHGDIGCYTLGNAAPLNMVDTCLCMGAGITMAQGMDHADRSTLNFAFVGDSTFFASGITGTVNAVYNQADMILCVLDNSTTAMTGHQPHPGMGITMMGDRVAPIDIAKVLEGIGVPWIRTVDPLDQEEAVRAVTEAIDRTGVRAIIFRSPCISLFKATEVCRVDAGSCIGCMRCVREIGCPALTPALAPTTASTPALAPARTSTPAQAPDRDNIKLASIDPALCVGCGLCGQICPTGCIETLSLEGPKTGSPKTPGTGKEDRTDPTAGADQANGADVAAGVGQAAGADRTAGADKTAGTNGADKTDTTSEEVGK